MKRVHAITGEIFDPSGISPEDVRRRRIARLRQRVWLAVELLVRVMGVLGGRLVMSTLTYESDGAWRPGQVSLYVRSLREDSDVRYYVWVAELTKRGRVHYHVIFLLPDKERWVKPGRAGGNWLWGDVTWVTDGVKKPWYIMKYLQKGLKKDGKAQHYPKGCRICGFSRSLLKFCTVQEQKSYRERQLPHWFVSGLPDGYDVRLAKRTKGGVSFGGTVAYSPWKLLTDFPDCDTIF